MIAPLTHRGDLDRMQAAGICSPTGELLTAAGRGPMRPLPCDTVYVIENETTYLAFPAVERAVALFGGGYAVSVLEQLHWLDDREIVYWGDIDTHGFAILDRLRRRFPRTHSLLMDRDAAGARRPVGPRGLTPCQPPPAPATRRGRAVP